MEVEELSKTGSDEVDDKHNLLVGATILLPKREVYRMETDKEIPG